MAHIILKKGEEHRILAGHPWIYKNEILKSEGNFTDGDVIRVKDYKNRFLGEGFINRDSQITIRLITQNKEIIDKSFLKNRIETAFQYRRQFIHNTNALRLISSEGDFLPGLIVDDYNGVLVMQTLTLGMEKRKNIIIDILRELINPKAIYERNDVHARELEGLPKNKGFLYGKAETQIECNISGIKMIVDIEQGHKTGIYLDQKENYSVLKDLVKNKDVLDCFCHTGAFSISAAVFGAQHVLSIDISDGAIEMARRNSELNNVKNICSWETGNVFDTLKTKKSHDIIILDPPSFTKTKDTISSALRGYKEINLRAMRLLPIGGYLITCCCSHHVPRNLFMEVMLDAAKDSRRKLRLIEYKTQSKDHPILPAVPETEYLKCFVLQVL